MRTTWRVTQVLAREGSTVATLEQVEWFRKNPDHAKDFEAWKEIERTEGADAADAAYPGELPPEFLEAEPHEAGADVIVLDAGSLTLDIGDEPLKPGDAVYVTIERAGP